MRIWRLATAIAVLVSVSGSLVRAEGEQIVLSRIEGKVLVDAGDGLEASLVGKQLTPGAKIYVGTESQADISFPLAGCTLKILPSSLVTVPMTAPCLPGQAWITATPVFAQPTADVPVDPSVGGVTDPGIGPALVAGGIAAVAIGAVILLTDDDNGNGSGMPVSRP